MTLLLSDINTTGGLRLRQFGGVVVVQVVVKSLPAGVHGYTDGETIFVDAGLSAEQLMCTIQHELIHVERGQGTKQLESEEMAVRYETAIRLLSVERIAGVCKTGTLSETAKALGVTKRVLMDRAATLTDEQASEAGCWECQKCPAIQMRAQQLVTRN